MACGIYKIMNNINGKFYIGSSTDIHRRYQRHLADLKKDKHDNSHLQNAWNLYGNVFVLNIVKECEISELIVEEQKELSEWFGNEVCYNLTEIAGQPVAPGEVRSEEVRRKISLSQKGKSRWTMEQRKQMSIDRKGRKHKPETIKKFLGRKSSYENIRKAQLFNLGRTYSEEHRNAISSGKTKSYQKNRGA